MDELPPNLRRLLLGGALAMGTGLILVSGLLLVRSPFADDPATSGAPSGDRPIASEAFPDGTGAEANSTPTAPPQVEFPTRPEAAPPPTPDISGSSAEPDLDQVIATYREAILRNREAIAPRLNLGAALMQKGRVQEALAEYEQARRLDDSVPELHYNLGNAYSQTGQTAEAIASYQQAIILRPDYANAHYNLGNSFLSLGQTEQAEQAYRDAIAGNAQFAEAYNNLGILLAQRQAYDEARETLTQAQALLKEQGKSDQLMQVEAALQQLPELP